MTEVYADIDQGASRCFSNLYRFALFGVLSINLCPVVSKQSRLDRSLFPTNRSRFYGHLRSTRATQPPFTFMFYLKFIEMTKNNINEKGMNKIK